MEPLYRKVEEARRMLGADAALAVLRDELLPACRGEVRAWRLFLEVCRERLGEKPGPEVRAVISEGLIAADRLIQQKAWDQALQVCVKLCAWDPWDQRILDRLAGCATGLFHVEVAEFLQGRAPDLEAGAPTLVVTADGGLCKAVPVRSLPFVIGTDPENHLVLEAPNVSRYHCQIRYAMGHFVVEDCGSRAGTYLDGQRIAAPAILREGSRIDVGPFTLVLRLSARGCGRAAQCGPPDKETARGRRAGSSASLPAVPVRPHSDRVHFSITGPETLQRASAHLLQIWAHREDQRDEVRQRAREAQPQAQVQMTTRGPHAVARGTVIDVVLSIPSLLGAPLQDTVLWEGEIASASFVVEVAPDARLGSHSGQVALLVGGIRLTTLVFVVAVGEAPGAVQPLSREEKRPRSAFASYASEDRDAVLARVQGIQKVAPDLDVFLDVGRLRSGEKWKPRLEREILARDVLYLFWSLPASRSTWVDWEWRTAYGRRGLDFIDPVPLADPREVPPPAELSELHFGDWVLAYMRGRGTGVKQP